MSPSPGCRACSATAASPSLRATAPRRLPRSCRGPSAWICLGSSQGGDIYRFPSPTSLNASLKREGLSLSLFKRRNPQRSLRRSLNCGEAQAGRPRNCGGWLLGSVFPGTVPRPSGSGPRFEDHRVPPSDLPKQHSFRNNSRILNPVYMGKQFSKQTFKNTSSCRFQEMNATPVRPEAPRPLVLTFPWMTAPLGRVLTLLPLKKRIIAQACPSFSSTRAPVVLRRPT